MAIFSATQIFDRLGWMNQDVRTTASPTFNTVTATNLVGDFSGNGENIIDLDADNIAYGTLSVARGGTGVAFFGGTNTVLYTTAANTLSSIPTVNNAVLITNSLGEPLFSSSFFLSGNISALNAELISGVYSGYASGNDAFANELTSTGGRLGYVNVGNNRVGMFQWDDTGIHFFDGAGITTRQAKNVSLTTVLTNLGIYAVAGTNINGSELNELNASNVSAGILDSDRLHQATVFLATRFFG